MNPIVGCSYIGKTPIYRIVLSNHDRAPMCWHYHETEDEAAQCKPAIEKYNSLTMPVDDSKVIATAE